MKIFTDKVTKELVNQYAACQQPSIGLRELHSLATCKNRSSRFIRDQMEKWAITIPEDILNKIHPKLINPKKWRNSRNELYAAYSMIQFCGCRLLAYEPSINSSKPDFLLKSQDGIEFYLEVFSTDPPKSKRTGKSDHYRIQEKIKKKLKKYKGAIRKHDLVFTVGIVPEFDSCIEFDDICFALDDHFLKTKDYLAGIFFLDYQTNNIETCRLIINSHARFPLKLKSDNREDT